MGLLDGFLTQLGTGDQVKDYKHASKLFHDGDQKVTGNALYPKLGYLYHVFFDIDDTLRQGGSVPDRATEAGMLVKSVDLPKFTIENKNLNSYGRPSIIQSKVRYDPVNFAFHDDSADRIRTLWAEYYSYYFRDMDNGVAKDGSIAPAYLGQDGRYDTDRKNLYGFTPLKPYGQPKHFIKSIRIYSLHQKRFSEYILVNPVITSFKHGTHSSSSTDPMQHDMTVAYEFVLYSEGNVTKNTVKGFSDLHYDTSPSPLKPANGTRSIIGPGGMVDTLDEVINSIPSDPIGGALKAFRGLQNANAMDLKKAAMSELTQFGMDVLRGDNPINRIAVPSIADISGKIRSVVTGVDQPGANGTGDVASNGSSSKLSAGLLTAGTALLATGSPQTVAGLGLLYAAGKTVYGKVTTPAQTSTPPAP